MNSQDEVGLEEFSQVTALLFAAAVDPARWPDFMHALSRISGGVSTQMFGHDLSTGQACGLAHSHYDDAYVRTYLDYYTALNPWAPAYAQVKPGLAFSTEAICPRAELERTEFYHDWIRPQGDISAGGGTVLFRESDRVFAIGGNLRRRDETRLQGRWMRLLERLGPMLRHALEMNRALAGQSIELAARDLLPAVAPAVLVLDARGGVRYANAAAQALIARGEGLRLTPQGTLRLENAPHPGAAAAPETPQARLERALRALKEKLPSHPHEDEALHLRLRLRANGGKAAEFDLRAVRLDPDRLETPPAPILFDTGQPMLLLALTPCRPACNPVGRIAHAWKLPAAEAEVLVLLGRGLTPQEIAAERGVSLHTVRAQVKSLLARTGTRRQTELLCRLWAEFGTGREF